MPKKRVTVSLDEEIIAEIEKRGLTVSNVVEEALRRYLNEHLK